MLRRPVDQFRFAIPDGFEVTEVSLAAVGPVGRAARGRPPRARCPAARADHRNRRAPHRGLPRRGKLDNWTAPRLEPLDVAGSVTVFGLVLEDRLRAESIAAEGLIPIDVACLCGRAAPDRATPAPAPRGWWRPGTPRRANMRCGPDS